MGRLVCGRVNKADRQKNRPRRACQRRDLLHHAQRRATTARRRRDVYKRQQFAQVTNPPIDPLREAHVMSLATSIGREMNVFCEAEGQAHRLSFKSPILLYSDFKQLTTMEEEHYRACLLYTSRCV